MIIETQQKIILPTLLSSAAALDFIRSPQRVFGHLDFLDDVQQDKQNISGIFIAQFPLIGEITLPFTSQVLTLAQGAQLIAQPLEQERAWLEISGTGLLHTTGLQQKDILTQSNKLEYQFYFRAHLQLPTSKQWGSRAFEKMVQASAQQSITRVLQTLPLALQQALQQFEDQQA